MIEFIYFAISVVLNLILLAATLYLFKKSKSPPQRQESVELKEFLMDLLEGGSLVQVKRIASADALIHTRHQR
jgi:hypothetical protein